MIIDQLYLQHRLNIIYYDYKDLIKIDSKLLEIAFDNLSSFELGDITIHILLHFMNLFFF